MRVISWPAVLIAAGLGLVFCFIPGLDAPNYHSALLISLPLSLTVGFVSMSAAARVLDGLPRPTDSDRADPRSPAGPSEAWLAGLKVALLPALIPLIILQINGLFVRQCDVFAGIGFFLIGPIFSALWAALVGASLACWAAPGRRRRRAAILLVLVFLGWAVWDVAHIYRNPAIFIFNPFVGYLQGALYDTVVEIDSRLLLYRLNNLVQLGLILGLTAATFSAAAKRSAWRHFGGRQRAVFATAISAAVCLLFFAARGQIGYEITRSEVVNQLGGILEDDRLILHYDRRIPDDEARALFEAHRFRIHQIETMLGATYPKRIRSFVYATPAQKRLLMGAAQVYIAKPWLDEIHLNRVPAHHPVIRHELAHVVLGLFAPPPFHIPTRMCVFPHMAVVEGAAETFEWDTGALNPHEWAHAMREAGKAVDLRKLLDPSGFLAQGSDKAYTLVGSFIRYLSDTYGMATLREVYQDADFERVYGRPTEDLVAEWERYVDGLEVPDDAAGLATGRFNVVAIQFRPCGLDVARVEQEAGKLAGDNSTLDAARERYEQVVAWIPEDAQKRVPLIRLAAGKGLSAVEEAYRAYIDTPRNHNVVSDAAAEELLADALVRAGDIDSAREIYQRVALAPQPEDKQRTTLMKLALASDPERAIALPYVVEGRRAALKSALEVLPDDPLLAYLAARRLHQDGQHPEALHALDEVLNRLGLEPALISRELEGLLRRETAKMVAEGHWQHEEFEAARAAWLRLAALARFTGDAERYRDFAEWADFKLAAGRRASE